MPNVGEAFVRAYMVGHQQRAEEERLALQKQLDAAQIQHVKDTADIMKRAATREERIQQMDEAKQRLALLSSGGQIRTEGGPQMMPPAAGIEQAVGAGATGAPSVTPGTGPASVTQNETIAPPEGAQSVPLPGGQVAIPPTFEEQIRRLHATTEATKEPIGIPKELTVTLGNEKMVFPPGTPVAVITATLTARAGIKEAGIRAQNQPLNILLGGGGLPGGGGGGTPPPAAPGAPQGPQNPTEATKGMPSVLGAKVRSLLDYTGDATGRDMFTKVAVAKAHEIDPTWSEDTFALRKKLKGDYMSGDESNNIKNINTATAHLGTLTRAIDALDNGDLKAWNSVKNQWAGQVGQAQVNNFQVAAQTTAKELAKVIHGAGVVPEGESANWNSVVSNVNSPDQLHGAVAMAIELMKGRMGSIQEKWERGMGKAPDQPFFSPRVLKTLEDLESRGAVGQAGAAKGIGRFQVVNP